MESNGTHLSFARAEDPVTPGLRQDGTEALSVGFFGVPATSVSRYRGEPPGLAGASLVQVHDPEAFLGGHCTGILVASLQTIIGRNCVLDLLRLLRPAQLLVYVDGERLGAREARVLSLLEGASMVSPGISSEDFWRVVMLARSGISSAPASLRRSLTVQMPDRLGYDDVSLLLRLVRGQSVSTIAHDMNRSEPDVHGLLSALYRRLGVRSLDETLTWSQQHGITSQHGMTA